MQYVFAITVDESMPQPGPEDEGFAEMREAWAAYGRAMAAADVLVDGASLTPSSSATTMRLTLGAEPTISDGPYAEAKEQLGGYYRIDVDDLDAAIAWAGKIPLPFGVVEIRPVQLFAASDGTPTPAAD